MNNETEVRQPFKCPQCKAITGYTTEYWTKFHKDTTSTVIPL